MGKNCEGASSGHGNNTRSPVLLFFGNNFFPVGSFSTTQSGHMEGEITITILIMMAVMIWLTSQEVILGMRFFSENKY